MQICHVIGARPNFMKAAPVTRALSLLPVEQLIVQTGHHDEFNMSDTFFRETRLIDIGSGRISFRAVRSLL
jgi:UDP-N-acetylglucosamine 2-epimerase (non-hydrolysing)